MQLFGIEFTPQEVECIAIALDRMQNEEEEHAASLDPAVDGEVIATFLGEAHIAESAREKWSEVRQTPAAPEYYAIVVEYCHPTLAGPFSSEDNRDAEARTIRNSTLFSEDGLVFWLDTDQVSGELACGSYAGEEMER